MPGPNARKRVLFGRRSSQTVASIAHALVLKNRGPFLVTERDGRIPLGHTHGFGLYYRDCRFLDGYELHLNGALPTSLAATASRGYMARVELTNPTLQMPDGTLVEEESIGITWERVIDGHVLTLRDRFTIINYSPGTAELTLTLDFRSRFQDIFVVRGIRGKRTGKAASPAWQHGVLVLRYHGVDGVDRSTSIHFQPAPSSSQGTTATFVVRLASHEQKELHVSVVLAESTDERATKLSAPKAPPIERVERGLQEAANQWIKRHTLVESDSYVLSRLVARSLRDLEMLRTQLGDAHFFAAGIPWFVTLFGRDSLITAMQMLMFNRSIGEQTLRLLARYQGTRVNHRSEEQPGRIPHELRVGELARSGEIPFSPYYGTIDATPLFLILLGEHASWTGDLSLFNDLRENVERALQWMDTYGDPDHNGYIEYESTAVDGLANQGWKDSGDAIMNADGSLCTPPIGLVEVQAYAYLARLLVAELYERAGEAERGAQLRHAAATLRERFNRDFWMEEYGCYALALEAGERQAQVIASNPGQALWTGIADTDKALRTVHRLMQEDMFSGWGIRTLSQDAVRYNPVGYHLGTVWPHDNSIIAAGFRRYGCDGEVQKIFSGIAHAALAFEHDRLPELFAGFTREEFGVPVHYPVADHPQAWAAGSIPFLLQTMLGLVPDAFNHRLRIVRPMLPDLATQIVVRGLGVGEARADLRFQRTTRGVAVDVLRTEGELDILVEPRAAQHTAVGR